MPNVKTHDVVGVVAGGLLTGGLYVGLVVVGVDEAPRISALFALSFAFGTFLLSPDLDVRSAVARRWGPLEFLWIPYRKLVPHRSVWSHGCLGSLLRVVYVCLWVVVPYGVGTLLLPEMHRPSFDAMYDMAWLRGGASLAAGVIVSGLVHSWTDRWWPVSQRRRWLRGAARRRGSR